MHHDPDRQHYYSFLHPRPETNKPTLHSPNINLLIQHPGIHHPPHTHQPTAPTATHTPPRQPDTPTPSELSPLEIGVEFVTHRVRAAPTQSNALRLCRSWWSSTKLCRKGVFARLRASVRFWGEIRRKNVGADAWENEVTASNRPKLCRSYSNCVGESFGAIVLTRAVRD
jgi:hypothetical protein